MKLNAIEHEIDDYLERQEAAENYQDRIEAKYLELRENPDALREAEWFVSSHFDEGHEANTTLMLYEFYRKGMTPIVERQLRTLAQERAEKMDIELYDLAKSAVEDDDKEFAMAHPEILQGFGCAA